LRQESDRLEELKNIYQKSQEAADRQYDAQKQSYYNWLQARSVIGSTQEDSRVRDGANALDRFRKIKSGWQEKIDATDVELKKLQEQRNVIDQKANAQQEADRSKYYKALQVYELKIFFMRLAFILPILALGVLIFVRFRKNSFWPLAWGFILFSLYAFFVGLLPYLPSFGGYIRLIVGVALSIFIGFYVIRQLNRYLKAKQTELQSSSLDRAKKIKEDIAVRAYQAHTCPSCERDFFLSKWFPKTQQALQVRSLDETSDFCTYCGLPLFGKCKKCGTRNFLHFPFCSNCGADIQITPPK
jgi:hypothetical protein